MIYILLKKILWAFITIINQLKVLSLWKSRLREKKLAEKKAKRLAKDGLKNQTPKENL